MRIKTLLLLLLPFGCARILSRACISHRPNVWPNPIIAKALD
jgi:hypothetical protein